MNMRGVFCSACFAAAVWVTPPLFAQEENEREKIVVNSSPTRTPVVELYTSEGCSSCPPADNWLRKFGGALGGDLHAVPLAFHVDYWDRLGWKDAYAQAKFTKRQYRLAAENFSGVYTPGLLVDGRETRYGRGAMRMVRIANRERAKVDIEMRIAHAGDARIEVVAGVDNRSGGALELFAAVYESGITREIGRGENRGRTLRHDFVVRHWSAPVRVRRGENRREFAVQLGRDWRPQNLGVAIIAFTKNGATAQAVRAPLAPLFAAR